MKMNTRHIFDVDEEVDDFFRSESELKTTEEDKTLQLKFNIEHYFLLGSPLGLFISVYSEENFIQERLPTCKYFYNIYHPQDVIAYRIEPLFKNSDSDVQTEQLPPVLLPYYRNNGYRPFNSFSTLFKKAPNTVVMKTLDHLENIKKSCRLEG